MSTSLKYFYAVSFVLIVIGAIVIGFLLRSMMLDGVEQTIKRDNRSLAQSYINLIWNRTYPVDKAKATPKAYQTFQAYSRLFTHQLTTERFAVYNHKGQRVYVSRKDEILDADGNSVGLDANNPVFKGHIISRTFSDASLVTNDGQQKTATIIQTFFPIPNAKYQGSASVCQGSSASQHLICLPTIGIIGIVNDISGHWDDLVTIQMVSTGSIIGIFIVLISILMFTTMRAEGIIAKQHEVNLELTAAAATAEAENREKSQFLANISHELRTPLNAIIGFSEIIKNEALQNLHETHQEYIRDIHSSGKHLLSLINDILDFSKAEAGKLEMDMTEHDLSKMIINSMRLVIPRAEEAQVTLVEDLPQDHIICTTDGKKLKQVLLNLLSNAVKFTPPGGEVRVTAWEQMLDGRICIQVKDSGIGIAPKDIAKVMSPFGQVDSKLSRRYEGTGLGLPLSKKFVEIMGGIFEIESEVDVGTTITIKLPGAKDGGLQLKTDNEPQP